LVPHFTDSGFDVRFDVRFDGGIVSSDGGLVLFRELEDRLCLADRLASCLTEPRNPAQIAHRLAAILGFRMLAIVAGDEDGNDCNTLRHDPSFKMALGRRPEDGPALCSQATISRLENLPSRTALSRMAQALVDPYCASFPRVPDRIVLDLDDSFDATHGRQPLQRFNADDDEPGFQPLVIFDGSGRLVTTVLRPAKRPSGREILTLLKRLVGRLRTTWPKVPVTRPVRRSGTIARLKVTATSSAWPAPSLCTGTPRPWRRPPRTGMPRLRPPIPRCPPTPKSAA